MTPTLDNPLEAPAVAAVDGRRASCYSLAVMLPRTMLLVAGLSALGLSCRGGHGGSRPSRSP